MNKKLKTILESNLELSDSNDLVDAGRAELARELLDNLSTTIVKVEMGYACGAGANHLSTVYEGLDSNCPWEALEEIAKQEGKILVASEPLEL
jgi:hypothetical protein